MSFSVGHCGHVAAGHCAAWVIVSHGHAVALRLRFMFAWVIVSYDFLHGYAERLQTFCIQFAVSLASVCG